MFRRAEDFRQQLMRSARRGLGKNVVMVATGNLGNYAAKFLALAILARVLGPSEFGSFSVAYAAIYVVRQLIGLGLQVAAVRFAAPAYKSGATNTGNYFFRTLLSLRIVIGGALILAAYPAAAFVFRSVPQLEEIGHYFLLVIVGGVVWSIADVPLSMFQAMERFWHYSLLNIVQGVSLIAGICWLIAIHRLTTESALFVAVGTMPVAMLVYPPWLLAIAGARGDFRSTIALLFSVGRWVMMSNILTAVTGRSSIFFLGLLSIKEQVGFFGAAQNLSAVLALLATPIFTAVFPRVLGLETFDQVGQYVKRMRTPVLGASLLVGIAGTIGIPIVIPILYGRVYAASVVAAILLWWGNVVNMNYSFLSPLFFRFDRPWIVTGVQFLRLIALAIGFWFLAPRWGAAGAALCVLITHLFAIAAYEWLVAGLLRSPDALPAHPT